MWSSHFKRKLCHLFPVIIFCSAGLNSCVVFQTNPKLVLLKMYNCAQAQPMYRLKLIGNMLWKLRQFVCVCVCVYIFEFALLVFLTCFVFSVFGQFCHFLTFWLSFKYIYIYICIYNIYSSEFFGLYLLIVYYLHHFISAFHFAFYVVLVIRPPWKGGQGHLM